MTKKYELVMDDMASVGQTIIYRIKALRSFGDVNTGDLGGYIESEDNLSHEGNCWVYEFGKVHDVARVSENGKVYGNAQMHNASQLYGDAIITADCALFDNVQVYGNAEVRGTSKLHDRVQVYDYAKIKGSSDIYGDTQIYRNSIIEGAEIKYTTHRCDDIPGCDELVARKDYTIGYVKPEEE